MKIFELKHSNGIIDWFSGETILQALVNYVNTTECSFYDLEDDELKELPENDWDNHNVIQDDSGTSITFREWMEQNRNSPEMIASTAY